MKLILLIFFLLYLLVRPSNLQLLINVRNQGGDVMQENITANVSEDTITLEFMRLDGVFVSQLVDFTNEVEAMKLIIPGEEELGQTGHQTFCFLTHAAQADFIAPDAMAKLRQKNPGTIRVAEEDKGWRQTTASAPLRRRARPRVPARRGPGALGAAPRHGAVLVRDCSDALPPARAVFRRDRRQACCRRLRLRDRPYQRMYLSLGGLCQLVSLWSEVL